MKLFPRKPKPKETLYGNAMRFVKEVEALAREQRYIQMFPHPGFQGRKGTQYNWVAMPNEGWRAEVLKRLEQGQMVQDFRFVPPDDLEGWTFHATSMVPTPRVALLRMDDCLP